MKKLDFSTSNNKKIVYNEDRTEYNIDLFKNLIKINSRCYKYLPDELKANKNIIVEALNNNSFMLEFVPDSLQYTEYYTLLLAINSHCKSNCNAENRNNFLSEAKFLICCTSEKLASSNLIKYFLSFCSLDVYNSMYSLNKFDIINEFLKIKTSNLDNNKVCVELESFFAELKDFCVRSDRYKKRQGNFVDLLVKTQTDEICFEK